MWGAELGSLHSLSHSTLTRLVRSSYSYFHSTDWNWSSEKFSDSLKVSQVAKYRVEIWNHMRSNVALATLSDWFLLFSPPLIYSSVEQVWPCPLLWPHLDHMPYLDHWAPATWIFFVFFLLLFSWMGCSYLRPSCVCSSWSPRFQLKVTSA